MVALLMNHRKILSQFLFMKILFIWEQSDTDEKYTWPDIQVIDTIHHCLAVREYFLKNKANKNPDTYYNKEQVIKEEVIWFNSHWHLQRQVYVFWVPLKNSNKFSALLLCLSEIDIQAHTLGS